MISLFFFLDLCFFYVSWFMFYVLGSESEFGIGADRDREKTTVL